MTKVDLFPTVSIAVLDRNMVRAATKKQALQTQGYDKITGGAAFRGGQGDFALLLSPNERNNGHTVSLYTLHNLPRHIYTHTHRDLSLPNSNVD